MSEIQESLDWSLHSRVIGPTPPLGRNPDDVLRRVLDVTGLAVHTVLRIDLQAVRVVRVLHKLIHPGRAVTRFRPRIRGQIDPDRNRRVLQRQVRIPVIVNADSGRP